VQKPVRLKKQQTKRNNPQISQTQVNVGYINCLNDGNNQHEIINVKAVPFHVY
jgi:hypothetical protein